MRNSSHDIRMRNIETDKANREPIQNSTKSHGEDHFRNNTKGQEKINLVKRKDQSKRHYTDDQTTEMQVVSICSQDERQQMDEKTDWHPYNDKRSRKKLDIEWSDEIVKFVGMA